MSSRWTAGKNPSRYDSATSDDSIGCVGSLGTWIGVSAVFASFAPLIDSNAGEPKIATFLIIIAMVILALMVYAYYIRNCNTDDMGLLSGILFIAMLLMLVYIWILVRIWKMF